MVERRKKEVITSQNYELHLTAILQYGIETFGFSQAEKYFYIISQHVESLDLNYFIYPECRYLATKSRMYRNIILDAHLIIYRIAEERIEVLDIIHSASSISKIRRIRSVRT